MLFKFLKIMKTLFKGKIVKCNINCMENQMNGDKVKIIFQTL